MESSLITSFKCRETALLFHGRVSRKIAAGCSRVAQRKLWMLHAAATLEDLKAPPSNHREALVGDRDGQHSIRVNDKWRICFVWNSEVQSAGDVEIVDYH